MNYIIIKNNSAIQYIDTDIGYMKYVIDQYTNYIYISDITDIKELNNKTYNDGCYIIKYNNNDIFAVEKKTSIVKGYIYNDTNIDIIIIDRWTLVLNKIDNMIENEIDDIYDKLLVNYKYMDQCINDSCITEYNNFDIDTVLDYSSILYISENNSESIDSQHDMIEYIMNNNDIDETELYIYDTNIYTNSISREKFTNACYLNEMKLDMLMSTKKQLLVIELNDDIINSDEYRNILNKRKYYNIIIIGIIKPLDIQQKHIYEIVVVYDIVNSVCSNNNIYNIIYSNLINNNLTYNSFIQNMNINNKYILFNTC